jgi:sigma-E factor negative regulatory protein RseA
MQHNSAQQASSLSALSDDELTGFERRRLLDRLLAEAENRSTLARYRLMGEALRHDHSEPLLGPDFFLRVSQALDAEANSALSGAVPGTSGPPGAQPPSLTQGNRAGSRAGRGWNRPLVGLAAAASVALISLWLAPQWLSGQNPQHPPVELALTQTPPSGPAQASHTGVQAGLEAESEWHRLPPEMEEKLNRYLVDHAEFAAGRGMDRMLPYASFVSYESRR